MEKERRGVYAGAVGRFDFAEDEMDTCIAIRTMTFKDGVAYLQAGGGIVFDSVEEEEYVETLNKLQGNIRAIEQAERKCLGYQIIPQVSPFLQDTITSVSRLLSRVKTTYFVTLLIFYIAMGLYTADFHPSHKFCNTWIYTEHKAADISGPLL